MSYEETFGALINWRENTEQQFKLFAEGICFRDNAKLTAEPVSIPADTKTLNWIVYDEDGNKRANVTFTKRPELRNFSMQNGQRIELDSMFYYSANVSSNQEFLIK